MNSQLEYYTLENKPDFNDGDSVEVDFQVLGMSKTTEIHLGKVVGKVSTHIVDIWMVEFGFQMSPFYRFRVIPVIHTAMIKNRIDL